VGEERTYHWGAEPTPNQRRVPVREAAELLGISEGAVRMRVKRGTLPSTRESGRLYVLLDTEPTPDPERPYGRTHDRTSELIATLREQLAAERRANEENRRIIAALTQRIPEIEAPASPQPPGAPESATEQPGRVEPQPSVEGAQEPREASEMHMPEAGGGPLPRDRRSQTPSERRFP
jgi:excisionase family DNA binding protein